ncbi:MAG TPA: protein kinase [Polyangiaceae bacterium]|nr:protein kinase [Polyangiaceae bacterium]
MNHNTDDGALAGLDAGPAPADAPDVPDVPDAPDARETLVNPVPAGEGGERNKGAALKHYEIVRTLGQGGMGTVYLARDTKLGRLVAIKVLTEHSEEAAVRFLSEARATARCKHENIVVIHEVDEFEGLPYMVFEYLEGRTLRDWLARRSTRDPARPAAADAPTEQLSAGQAVELMVPVVRALACAHRTGIVHRDLKPANIFLTDAGPIKVLDFGIAKRLGAGELSAITAPAEPPADGDELTRPGALVGTLPYMAPEQWLGAEVDARTDLWAVGIILYRLVTGEHPLEPPSTFQLLQISVLEQPMPSVYRRRPDLGPLGAVIDRCLKKPKDERFGSADELLAALESLGPGPRAPGLGEGRSPFAGLAAFQEADAGRFFGREREASAVLGRLRSQPLVALAGPSGAGKSSLVRAGVIPALKRAHEGMEAFVLRPGRRPLGALGEVLAQAAAAGAGEAASGADPEALASALRAQPGLLGARLRARCRARGAAHRVLLLVDQFEELYTLGAGPAERAAFLDCLEGAADDASSPLRVVLCVRSDFLDRLAEDGPFAAEATRGLILLPPMEREGLRDALVRPVEAAGHRFESEAMVEGMLAALAHTRGPLPLLQFTAAQLWEARDRERRLLTEASYERLGGVAGALSAHADAVLAGLSAREQRLCREVFLRLVTPERTRAVVGLGELRALADDADAVERVVRHLAEARLVLVEPGGEREGTTVELVHESLIDRWSELAQWLDEGEQDAQFFARLRAAAQPWEASGEPEGLLWRDAAAEDARAWLKRRRAAPEVASAGGLGRREERYLAAVVALSERDRRRKRQVTAAVFAALSAIALVVSYLAVRANRDAALARNATRMAAAREVQPIDPTTALALVREVERERVPRGWADLARLALQSGVSRQVLAHPGWVRSAAFSPDGRRVATACDDKTLRVFSADGRGEPLVLRGHEGPIFSLSFGPDGRRIATASSDKTVRVYDADGRGEPVVLRGHEGVVNAAAFSPDGRRVATASGDKALRVFSADGRGEPLVLRGHEGALYSVAWSPDGRRLATASEDKTVRVWAAEGAGEPLVLRGHEGMVVSVAFSPDGQRIVSGSYDRTARVWGEGGAGEPVVLRGHEGWVMSAAFGPDGQRVVTASVDKTARVWPADGRGEPLVLRGHEGAVLSAAFSPDGRRLLSTSQDTTVRLWDADGRGLPIVLRGHEDWVLSASFSPDGRRLLTASEDKTARVYDANGRGELAVLRGHEGPVQSAAFSPDGRRIATGSDDKTVRVWAADGAGEPLVLRGHEDWVFSLAWSPDGRRLISGSQDLTARIWNADGAGEPVVLRGHEGAIQSVAFSPDGQRVATGALDRVARVWPADGRGEPLALRGHEATVTTVAFSPDGRRLVTASEDKTVRVWAADGAGEPLVWRGHGALVAAASFSPDGRRILTGGWDKTARIWSADGTGEPLVLLGHEGVITSAAWSPDGRRIITGSQDKTARVWSDLEPLRGTDDPALWLATAHCLSVERRVELLHVTEAQARADERDCERRVEAARAAAR